MNTILPKDSVLIMVVVVKSVVYHACPKSPLGVQLG